MNKLIFILTLTSMLFSCNTANEKKEEISSNEKKTDDGIILKKFDPLIITGDFDGEKKQDTITQCIGSKYKKGNFDSIVDPSKNHWDVVTNWHFNRAIDLYLMLNAPEFEVLNLGPAQGLYCLINIGDNNSDKKDEIALVVDQLDVSNLNNCKIFTICDGKWKLLKEFGINEDAFNNVHKEPKVFSEIKNYLEYKSNTWVYKDYKLSELMNPDTVVQMEKLKLDRCN